MTYSHLDPAMQNRVSWNAGKTVGTKRPLTQKQIWAIRFFLDREERLRDRALFDLAAFIHDGAAVGYSAPALPMGA